MPTSSSVMLLIIVSNDPSFYLKLNFDDIQRLILGLHQGVQLYRNSFENQIDTKRQLTCAASCAA